MTMSRRCLTILLIISILTAYSTFMVFSSSNQLPMSANNQQLSSILERFSPDLGSFELLYRRLHQHAELSARENETARTIAAQLRKFDFVVIEGIGGHGLVGILDNGPGKIVMLRAELDALPIEEKTGLPFACKKRMLDEWNQEQPVMHACGHDMHMSCLLAAARLLSNARTEWTGTLLILFQPNEEHVSGAQAMVDNGLYDKVPVPDVIFAQHGMEIKSGMVSVKPGPVLVSADTVRVRLFASFGHPMNPQIAADPIRTAATIITKIDKLIEDVGRGKYAAIRIDQLHAGKPGDDWVDHADLVLDIKTFDQKLRYRLQDNLRDLIVEESRNSGAVQEPEISIIERAQITINDDGTARKLKEVFREYFGAQRLTDQLPAHPVEDFSKLATAKNLPYVFWWIGRVDPAALDNANKSGRFMDEIAIEHSPFNAPALQPTMKTGMEALSLAALSFFSD